MAACDPQSIISANPCLNVLSQFELEVLKTQLLCQISDSIISGGGGGLAGAGSPEGVVTASPGRTYWDTTNKAFYVKDTGTGNTGWQFLAGV